jgi:hypothetical protein
LLGEVLITQNGLLAKAAVGELEGKGNSIKVWEDNWVPSQNGFKVLTQNGDNSTVFLVRDLLEQLPNKFLLS